MSFKLLDLKVPLAAIKMDLNEDLTFPKNKATLFDDVIEALNLETGFKSTAEYTLSPGLYDDGFIALQTVKSNIENNRAPVNDELIAKITEFNDNIKKLNGGRRQSRSRQSRKSRSSRQSRSRKSSTRKSQRRA